MVSEPLSGPKARRAGVVHEDVRRSLKRTGAGHVERAGCRVFRGRSRRRPGDGRVAVGGGERARELDTIGARGGEFAASPEFRSAT